MTKAEVDYKIIFTRKQQSLFYVLSNIETEYVFIVN